MHDRAVLGAAGGAVDVPARRRRRRPASRARPRRPCAAAPRTPGRWTSRRCSSAVLRVGVGLLDAHFVQSASSSSATITAMPVRVPWPISERPQPHGDGAVGSTRSQALGWKSRPELRGLGGRHAQRARRPARARRRPADLEEVAPIVRGSSASPPSRPGGWRAGCARRSRSGRGCRPSRRRCRRRWGGVPREQRGGGHDLPGLAVAALRDLARRSRRAAPGGCRRGRAPRWW